MAAFRDENIGRLDVAVDDSLAVRGVQTICNVDSDFQQAVEFESATADQMLEGRAFHVLHHDEGAAIDVPECHGWCRCWDDSVRKRRALRAESVRGFAGPGDTFSGRNLRATKRPSLVSWALYTTPMPPPPSFSIILYCPSVSPIMAGLCEESIDERECSVTKTVQGVRASNGPGPGRSW